MQSGDADVVQTAHVIAHEFRRPGGLLGDREISGARGGDDDGPLAAGHISLAQRDDVRVVVVDRVGESLADRFKRRRRRARDQQRRPAAGNLGRNGGDLGGRLAEAEDDFGEALAKRSVMIDAGEAEVFERLRAQRLENEGVCGGRFEVAARDLFDQLLKLFV